MAKTGRPPTWTSHCDLYGYLRDRGPAEVAVIVHEVGYTIQHTRLVLAELRALGLAHIAAWREVTIGGGHPAQVWAFGQGEDAPKPPKKDERTATRLSHRRRYHDTKAKYGVAVAQAIHKSRSKGGAETVVIDGKVIYRRKPRANNQGVTA